MGAILLDTTVLIDVLRGRPAAERMRALRQVGDTPCVCSINVEEIFRGVRPSEREAAQRLCAALALVPLGNEEGQRAGDWRRHYADRGRSLSQADCLVAAAALTAGGRLATGNPRDFPMSDLQVEHWPVGE